MRTRALAPLLPVAALAALVLVAPAAAAGERAYRYDRTGEYLDYAQRPYTLRWPTFGGTVRTLDSQGILLTLGDGRQIRSAVEDGVYGLVEFSKFKAHGGRKHLRRAKQAAVWLSQKMDPVGLFHYYFDADIGGERPLVLRSGWYGALGQATTASLGERLYRQTGNRFYRDLALRATAPFSKMITQDGVQSRFLGTEDLFFEGYGTFPTPVHTLDHFLYSLIALYDMADISPTARELFNRGLETLTKALPYYDITGADGRPRTTSWLGHLTDPPRPAFPLLGFLQEQEVALLRALSSLRPKRKILRKYHRRYARQMTWICDDPAESCEFRHRD